MTDRVYALTVILEDVLRDDDCQPLIIAIRQMRHVQDVRLNVARPETYWARREAVRLLRDRLLELMNNYGTE